MRLTADLAGLACRMRLCLHPPTNRTHTHIHTLASAASLQVNSFDSCPLHLSQSCALSCHLSILVKCLLSPFSSLPVLFTSKRRPRTVSTCAVPFQFPIHFLVAFHLFIIPIQFPFPRPSCFLFLPHSLPPTYLGYVLHMHEGCGKVLASAQTLS